MKAKPEEWSIDQWESMLSKVSGVDNLKGMLRDWKASDKSQRQEIEKLEKERAPSIERIKDYMAEMGYGWEQAYWELRGMIVEGIPNGLKTLNELQEDKE